MEKTATYTVLGDSISIGYCEFIEKYFPKNYVFIKKTEGKEAYENLDIPVGTNCGDSRMLLDYLTGCKSQNKLDKDIYIINCGLHDIKVDRITGAHQVEPYEYELNLSKIFEIFKSTNAQVYWVSTTDVDDAIHNAKMRDFLRFKKDLDQYNTVADKVCSAHNMKVIDLYSFTLQFGKEGFCDHVHYPEGIREQQAEFIAKEIFKK